MVQTLQGHVLPRFTWMLVKLPELTWGGVHCVRMCTNTCAFGGGSPGPLVNVSVLAGGRREACSPQAARG